MLEQDKQGKKRKRKRDVMNYLGVTIQKDKE